MATDLLLIIKHHPYTKNGHILQFPARILYQGFYTKIPNHLILELNTTTNIEWMIKNLTCQF